MPILDGPLLKAHSSRDSIEALLTPSWLSGLVAVAGALVVVLGYVGMIMFRSSDIHMMMQTQAAHAHAAASGYSALGSNLPPESIWSNLPLAIVWAGVGLVAYSFASTVFSSLRSAVEMRSEMSYVHANRHQMLKDAGFRLGFRTVALVVWFIYLNLTVHLFVPYAVAVAYAGTSQGSWPIGLLYVLGAVSMLAICLHLHAVLLRLVALRPRLFGA